MELASLLTRHKLLGGTSRTLQDLVTVAEFEIKQQLKMAQKYWSLRVGSDQWLVKYCHECSDKCKGNGSEEKSLSKVIPSFDMV